MWPGVGLAFPVVRGGYGRVRTVGGFAVPGM